MRTGGLIPTGRRDGMWQGLRANADSERRVKKRIYVPFPAVVEGLDVDSKAFSVNTVVDNLNDRCVYLRIVPSVEQGAVLSVTFSLSATTDSDYTSSRVRLRGEVVRTDSKPGGGCGVAVVFSDYQWL
jgi:hypothetical protein